MFVGVGVTDGQGFELIQSLQSVYGVIPAPAIPPSIIEPVPL